MLVWYDVYTVNSPIKAQCAQTQHRCALIWKVEVKSFPTVYDNPYFPLYRHVIYRWKALHLNLKDLKEGDAPLLEVRPYWGIYGILDTIDICIITMYRGIWPFKFIYGTKHQFRFIQLNNPVQNEENQGGLFSCMNLNWRFFHRWTWRVVFPCTWW